MDQFPVEINIDDYWNSQYTHYWFFSLYLTNPAFLFKCRNGEVIFARRCFHDDPALKTKKDITKYINWQQFTKSTHGKPNEQRFPRQVAIQLPKYVSRIHVIDEPKYKYGQQEQATARNHNKSTAPERSVSKHSGAQTGLTNPQTRPQPPPRPNPSSRSVRAKPPPPQPTNGPLLEKNKSRTNTTTKQRRGLDRKTVLFNRPWIKRISPSYSDGLFETPCSHEYAVMTVS